MKNRINTQKILSVLLAALVVFSSLEFEGFTGEVQAEEAAAEPAAEFPSTVSGTWLDTDTDNSYKYVDTKWYDEHSTDTAFTITTAEELAGLAKLVNKDSTSFANKTITITGTIDLGAHYWIPINSLSNTTIIGQDCNLAGLYLSKEKTAGKWGNQTHIGLIADMYGGSIDGVNIADSLLDSAKTCDFVGFLIGYSKDYSYKSTTLNRCNVRNSAMYAGSISDSNLQGLHTGGLSGSLDNSRGKNPGTDASVTASSVENLNVFFKEINIYQTGGSGSAERGLIAGLLVGGNNGRIKFDKVSASGQMKFENITWNADRIVIGGIIGYASDDNEKITGAYSKMNLMIKSCVIGSGNKHSDDSAYVGGIVGKGPGVENSQFDGSIQLQNNRFKGIVKTSNDGGNFDVGGISGKVSNNSTILRNCINTGDLTIEGNTYPNQPKDSDWYINAGGIVGSTEQNINIYSSYSTGRISGESAADTNDHKGGIAGNVYIRATISTPDKDVFYLNTNKAFGSASGGDIQAIPLAQIVKNGTEVNRIQQGDNTAFIEQGDQTVFDKLAKGDKLGANFSVALPDASQFKSSNTDAALVISENATAGIKTVIGGDTTITAPVTINQNQLDWKKGTFTGDIVPGESPVLLTLTVANVQIANTSLTSAIDATTPYQFKADLKAYGSSVALDNYTYAWEFLEGSQNIPPDGEGVDIEGLTQNPASIIGTQASADWSKADTKFNKTADVGWYRLRAAPTAGNTDPYTFYSPWQYLSIDDLMVIGTADTPSTLEFSAKDTADYIQARDTLSATIQINSEFNGTIEYQWYHDGQPVKSTNEVKKIDDTSDREFTAQLSLGIAYAESMRGAYELRIVKVTPDQPGPDYDGTRDIRGVTTTVKCYSASAVGQYTQSGPRYAGLTAVMEQTGITLSPDFISSGYSACFIKADTIGSADALTNAHRAELTQDPGSGTTYSARASFTMAEGDGTNDSTAYCLIVYPVGTKRQAVGTEDSTSDTAMQFAVAKACVLDSYKISGVTYPLQKSYSIADLEPDTSLAGSQPTVTGYNSKEGTLRYTKTSGAADFEINGDTGEIICTAEDSQKIRNGTYTLTVQVQDIAYTVKDKDGNNVILSVPGTNYTKMIAFDITGSDTFILNKNLYIFDGGYAFAEDNEQEPVNKTADYSGSYQITAPDGSAGATAKIIVVSGAHTEGRRIQLETSINSTGPPITVRTGATAEIQVGGDASLTLTNSDTSDTDGAVLQNDGGLILSGEGALALTGNTTGNGSLTLRQLALTAGKITQTDTTIESGFATATEINGNATIKGGNVKVDNIIGTGGTTTITGGSIIGNVNNARAADGSTPVYPVTLQLSETPDSYAGVTTNVTDRPTNTSSGTAAAWTAKASSDSFKKDGGGKGELYVYLPRYQKGYTAVTTTFQGATVPYQELSRKINATTDSSLTAILLATEYNINLLENGGISSNASVGHGIDQDFTIQMNINDGWLNDGRSLDLEVSPNPEYRTIWGKYMLRPESSTNTYCPEFWIQTPDGRTLEGKGPFGTMRADPEDSGKDVKALTGHLIVPASSKITEGIYKSQINWKITPNDPVVGGEN